MNLTNIGGNRYLVFIKLIFNFARFFKCNVNKADQYQVAFSGLNPGSHIFDFEIGDAFFEDIQDAEISGGAVAVQVVMVKEERMMDLHLTISGVVKVPCDRCNELMDLAISGNERLIVKLGEDFFEESEDIQVIPETSHQFDLAPFLYEYIHLLMPVRRVHPEEGEGENHCDPEVIKRLSELSEHHNPDPRWEVLNRLKENN